MVEFREQDSSHPRIIRDDQFVNIYVNRTTISSNNTDFAFIFSQNVLGPGDSERPLEIHEKAFITMAPSHAKTILRLLNAQVERYEQDFGPIPILPKKEPAPAE